MTYHIQGYHPESLFQYFEEISAIPRSSGKEQAISNYLIQFAKFHQLDYDTDDLHNVVIKKPASEGFEHLPTVMLQGHQDMVCEKNADVTHNFDTDPIELIVKDGWVSANGTTLGADNGAAVAMMLALLSDNTLIHPPLECVFTVQEEIGLLGAQALDPGILSATTMINLDSEEEGIATVSCAGGMRVLFTRKVEWEPAQGHALQIMVKGLLGGHSGADIHLERANANKLMGRILYHLMQNTPFKILSIQGGSKENAIPRECTASILFADQEEKNRASAFLNTFCKELLNEFLAQEPDAAVVQTPLDAFPQQAFDQKTTEALIQMIYLAPNGAQTRNLQQGGFIISSLNMGVIQTSSELVTVAFSPRSSVDSLQQEMKSTLQLFAELFDFSIEISGEYPGWSYAEQSPIRKIFCESYRKLFGQELKIEAIHAGLECGLFCGKIPNLDAIAIGPTMKGCHTPDETMELASCERTWKLLTEVLSALTK